jgi:hypothetical protein
MSPGRRRWRDRDARESDGSELALGQPDGWRTSWVALSPFGDILENRHILSPFDDIKAKNPLL